MNRRGFFQTLAAGLVTVSLDPDRLLWTPGAKLISIPKPRQTIVQYRQGFAGADPSTLPFYSRETQKHIAGLFKFRNETWKVFADAPMQNGKTPQWFRYSPQPIATPIAHSPDPIAPPAGDKPEAM